MNKFFSRAITIKRILLAVSLAVIIILFNSLFISLSSNKYTFDRIDKLPDNKVGLLLGTSKYLAKNRLNPYYTFRIDAAEMLYKSGKIKFIIASGDNRKHSYNEPKIMKKDLIRRGIPAKSIYNDFAGFRTLDSIVRCKKIFSQNKFTVISQKFHNQRAIFIAKRYNINATGFNANDIKKISGLKTKVRELFARAKATIDLYIINKQPKYLGKKIIIK